VTAKPEQLALPGLRLHIIYVLVPRSHRRDRSDEHLLGFGVGDDGLQVSNQLFERGDRSPQTCLGDESIFMTPPSASVRWVTSVVLMTPCL
jgi:hypothetical protein